MEVYEWIKQVYNICYFIACNFLAIVASSYDYHPIALDFLDLSRSRVNFSLDVCLAYHYITWCFQFNDNKFHLNKICTPTFSGFLFYGGINNRYMKITLLVGKRCVFSSSIFDLTGKCCCHCHHVIITVFWATKLRIKFTSYERKKRNQIKQVKSNTLIIHSF